MPKIIINDSHMRSAISKITNSALSDIHYLQASMPIAHGGLGVRRLSSLTIPALLALSCHCIPVPLTFLDEYLSMWSLSPGPPPDPLPGKQSFWDRPGLLTDRALIESSLVEPSQRARFLAAQAPHSGDWLLALPIANCGLRLNDEAVRVAVGMRLGLSLHVPHNCYCGWDLSGCPRSSHHEDRANHKTT